VTEPAAIPSDIAPQVTQRCGLFHKMELGENCNNVIMKFGIALRDFLFLNPSVNENCTNVWANYSYCVRPVGDSELIYVFHALVIKKNSQYLFWT
jgi:hypothetical protein